LRRSDGVRREQAARSRDAPGVRRRDERAGLHARVAVLRGAMGAGPNARAPFPVAPGQGPGWARVAEAVAAQMPPAEIASIYLFRPIKREGRERGTAVVTGNNPDGGGRGRGYTARYTLVVRGTDRGPRTGEGQ